MYKILSVLLLLAYSGSAQESKNLNLTKAINSFQEKINKEEKSEDILKKKLEKIDEEVNGKLKKLVERLIKARDSNETGTLVIRNKKKIISDLEKSQKKYLEERASFDKDLQIKELPEINDLKSWFDKNINKNIKEITKVTDSLAHYREYYDDDWRNTYNDRRNVKYADREKERVVKTFEKQALTLSKKLKELDAIHDSEDSSSEYMHKCIKACDEIVAINTRISLLEHSMDDIINGGKDGSKIGKVSALSLDRDIRRGTSEIRGQLKSFYYTLRLYKWSLMKKNKLLSELEILKRLNGK